MLAWFKAGAAAFSGGGRDGQALAEPEVPPRAAHARMLARAAARRRAAVASLRAHRRVDALYWKCCAPGALFEARTLRALRLKALP